MNTFRSRQLAVAVAALCAAFTSTQALADNVVPDDQIIQGSACVGMDCVDNENFGFDTMRLKENNLRIDFEDTSVGAFPSNDWGIVINDNASGGSSYFQIEDRGVDGTTSNSVLRIDAGATGAVTLGFGSTSSGGGTVSIGSAGGERRLTNVGTAIAGTDAVNLDQMTAAIAASGASTAYADAGDAATLDAARNYADAGDAATLDAARDYADAGDTATLDAARNYADAGDTATLDAARNYADAGDAATLDAARDYADAGDTATLDAARNFADAGDAATLTTARNHADAGDTTTLQSANGYTDTRSTATLNTARAYTDTRLNQMQLDFGQFQSDVWNRLDRTDTRINRMGALTSAMAQMTANATGGHTARGRLAMGAGFQGGQQALSIGYGRAVGDRASLSLGAAFSGSENTAGIGFGLDL